jgi:hypothetical protein
MTFLARTPVRARKALMPETAGFDKLQPEFTELAATRAKTDDDVRSLRYFEVDQARNEGRITNEPSPWILDWIDRVRRLELFISVNGRLPVENRRRPDSEISDEERVLSRWKADQLRAARRGPLASYQIRRLEGLDGFRWAPLDDRWDEHFDRYRAFAAARQPPRYRAGGTEQEVARWAQRQRGLYRRGALPQTRINRLEGTGFWAW